MIKRLQASEIDVLAPLAQNFFSSSGHPGFLDFDSLRRKLTNLVNSNGVIYANVINDTAVSAIGGLFYPDFFTDELIALETFWFTQPGHRGAGSLNALFLFLDWAIEMRCVRARLSRLAYKATMINSSIDHFYTRIGCTPAEIVYELDLTIWQSQQQPQSQSEPLPSQQD